MLYVTFASGEVKFKRVTDTCVWGRERGVCFRASLFLFDLQRIKCHNK
jgi:hypothetical protein